MTIVPVFTELEGVELNGQQASVQTGGSCDMWDASDGCMRQQSSACPLLSRCNAGSITIVDNRLYVREEGEYRAV